ncbi:MAG: aldose 1-epimerase family protein [Planctomycetaceae bacterium]|jgi:galactose mutarotase-like enzyme|nr:aldose 1-epimerase family protein [Planctomycetaceae bacterium]
MINPLLRQATKANVFRTETLKLSCRETVSQLANESLRVVVSSQGAEMLSLSDVRSGVGFLWQGDARYWNARSPILFPIVGRVQQGAYLHRGRRYAIHSPHGFTQYSAFRLEYSEPDRLRFLLESSEETLKQYPFPFRLRVEYILRDQSLQLRFRIENTGAEEMPFSLGIHPGFRVPIENEERFEDYSLQFADAEDPRQILLDGVFLSGKQRPFPLKNQTTLPLERRVFDNDGVILSGIRRKTVSLLDPGGRKRWSLSFEDFDCLALWQPKNTDAPFVSLEPWNGLPDLSGHDSGEITCKPGIRTLSPESHADFSVGIAIEDY